MTDAASAAPSRTSEPRRHSRRIGGMKLHDFVIPFGVLAIGLLFTLLVSELLQGTVAARNLQRFREDVAVAHKTIEARLTTYIAMLRAGAGFYEAMPSLTEAGFRRFVNQLRLEDDYRGVQGYGFSQRVLTQDLPEFVAARRDEGQPDFQVTPDIPRDVYHVVKYLEPQNARNQAALGFDMFTEPTRRAAMERARDNGVPAASGKVELVQEIAGEKQAGFIIYTPVYIGGRAPEQLEDRRQFLAGFIYSPFRAGDFLEAILDSELGNLRRTLAIAVYDGAPEPENLLYSSHDPADSAQADFNTREPLTFAGRTWTIAYSTLPAFRTDLGSDLLRRVPLFGTIISILFALIAGAQVRARRQAQTEAQERRIAEARVLEREERLRGILDSIYAFVFVLDRDGRIVEANRAPLEATARELSDIRGRPLWDCAWWFDTAEQRQALREAIAKAADGQVSRQDIEVATGAGPMILDLQVTPVRSEGAEVQLIVPFGVDVTDRRRAEEHRRVLLGELNHRVKNSLAVIQSLARQTGATTKSVPDFLNAFHGRLSALGAAHGLIMETGWPTARLDDLVRMALRPQLVHPEEQLEMDVEPVLVSAELAQNLALILHELATNAVKYGALATGTGSLALSAKVSDDGLSLVWTERGGPAVKAPKNQGFGSTLLNALIVGRHKGNVDLDWRRTGLVCTVTIPAEELEAQATT